MSAIKDVYNQILARLAHRQRVATAEQLRAGMAHTSADKDLGQVLIEQGLMDFQEYLRFHNYITKLMQAPNAREKIREILGSGAKPAGREVPGRVQQTRSPQQQPAAQAAPPQQQTPPQQQASPAPIVHVEEEASLPAEWRGSPGDGQLRMTVPTALSAASTLDEILLFARKHKASDVHLSPGSPIILRRFSRMKPVSQEPLTADQIREILQRGMPRDTMEQFMATGDAELAYPIEGGGRYRMTLVKQRFGWELTARVIPSKIQTFEQSGLPKGCAELTKWAQGLVLVTGPMGCGKTTTLATLVDMINADRHDHIITIEQPVEIVYEPKGCQITQREIGYHTLSQGNALRGALRQDPDIIVISELRDLDSISLAVSAAETGHLVLATMNTANAQRTVNRLIDAFPPDEQEVVRNMISETLRGVISQQLVPLKDNTGLVPAYEVLLVTKAIGNLIRKNNMHQLPSAMLTGRGMGMVLLDESLKKLVQEGRIEGEEAFYRATDQRQFKQFAPDALKETI